MVVKTGIVGKITVSGTVISGAGASGAEARIVYGREVGKFNPVGTDVSVHTDGMKKVEGTIRKTWISGDTLMYDLMNNKTEFDVVIEISGEASITASGCRMGDITRAIAPGTEVMMEEAPYTGLDWY